MLSDFFLSTPKALLRAASELFAILVAFSHILEKQKEPQLLPGEEAEAHHGLNKVPKVKQEICIQDFCFVTYKCK